MDGIKRFLYVAEKNMKFNVLTYLLIVLFFVLTVVALFVIFNDTGTQIVGEWFGTLDGKEDKQKTLLFIGGIMGGLIALIIAAIRHDTETQVKNNQIASESNRLSSENNKLIEKGHIEDRVRSATDLLTKNQTGARITAFYQFYYLAKDDENENFRKNIFDILCSHLRNKTRNPKYQKDNKAKPSEEIQTLLDILFKPENKYGSEEEGKTAFRKLVPDLHGVYLAGADLNNAYLPQTDFSDACLIGADMGNTKLHKCIFNNTKMHGTDLSHANMQLAIFDGTKLMGSDLFNANMQGAILRNEVGLQAAHLYLLKMQGIKISGATGNTITEEYDPDSPHCAHAGGAYSTPSCATMCTHNITDYKARVLSQAGKKGDISDICFSGDLDTLKDEIDNTVKFLKNYIGEEVATDYQKKLQEHAQKPSKETTEDYKDHIYLTPYKPKHAEKWIAEYNEVMQAPL